MALPITLGNKFMNGVGTAVVNKAAGAASGEQLFPKLAAKFPKLAQMGRNAFNTAAPVVQNVGEQLFNPGSTTGTQFDAGQQAIDTAAGGNALGNNVDTQLQKAMNGELTDPGSDFYNAQTAQMDINAADAKKSMVDDMSWNGQTGGGVEGRAMMDFNRKLAADKNAVLADTQNQYGLAAINRAGQKDANQLNLSGQQIGLDANKVNADLATKQYYQSWVPTISNALTAWQNRKQNKAAGTPSKYTNNAMNFAGSV